MKLRRLPIRDVFLQPCLNQPTEYDWPVGHMMEMSKMGMEQCLDKMAAIFAKP